MTKAHVDHVRLGFEVPTGKPVDIPIRHMCVTGQTQEAGKTTTLEALITRSQLRALTFITKRGEGSFGGAAARMIQPYFREQADWEFVSAILEASRGERMKFERSWIIRASKGAQTLADVQRNVKRLMEKAKGLSADVYLTLDTYLETVVPTIAGIKWAKQLELDAGVNVVDLVGLPMQMHHLVIKSSIDWVLAKEQHTIVVIPEAWQFIPQGRGTPVKLSALRYIRQGAALRNYLWLDSQDIGGIEKEVLRSVPVWILGVQREANEIKRTLSNIPATVAKPSPADIATLELGQFLACWGKHVVKTYVQPVWIRDAAAIAIAQGRELVTPLEPPRPVHRLEEFLDRGLRAQRAVDIAIAATAPATSGKGEGDEMNPAQEKKLDAVVTNLERLTKLLAHPVVAMTPPQAPRRLEPIVGNGPHDDEVLYQSFKARLLGEIREDPAVLEILLNQPQLRVKVERPVIQVDGDSLQGRLARLILEGYFDEPRTVGHLQAELTKRGAGNAAPNISKELGTLARMGFLTRDNKWYRVVEAMKGYVHEEA